MCYRRIAVPAILFLYRFHTFKLAVMLPSFQCVQHLCHQIIDIKQFQFYRRVVYLNWQIIGQIMTECSHCRIVVWTAPLSEKIRKAVYKDPGSRLFSIPEEKLFSRQFGFSIVRTCISPQKSRLNRRGQHDRATVLILFQSLQQRCGKTKISFHKLFIILGTVYPCQVKNKICLFTIFIQ